LGYPPARLVAGHLDRLGRALEALAARVRDGLAGAIATVVGDAIAQALGAVLDDVAAGDIARGRARAQSPGPHSLWDQSRRPGWHDDPLDPSYAEDDDYPDDAQRPAPAAAPVRHRRWARALVAGAQAAAWWLRRPGRGTLLAALGVGLAAGLASLAGGPVAAAAAGLAGTALGLAAVADAVRPDPYAP
jgi:hypothetical protein